MRRSYLLLPAVTLVLAACSGGASGSPAESGARTIQVNASDELRFAPAELTVSAGETVRFEVHNTGQIVHEFVIGDADVQAEHEMEMGDMASGMEMADEANAITLQPGETKTLEYTFEEAGELLAGCHEPGHYDAGMVATITVE
jgi:uncharacterized cupredoxin-like copper-binding protein